MAEARSEEEEENMMREPREQVVRRQPGSSAGRPDRRKPEHRHSQGPLSSIRAAIKRTSTRSTSLSEPSRDRDRRRPEITILSAEPLASTSWFPGAAGGFPPPPPPAAQIWGPTIPPAVQPPPSYEEVIREKTQEQELPLSAAAAAAAASSTITIATQTDPGSAPVRPPRPPLPQPPADDITAAQPACDGAAHDQRPPLTAATVAALPERPRPRPRSRLSLQPISSEVKVQTLVKLRDDGLATLAARAQNANAAADQQPSQGKYLQELLAAFSADDWGFPDRRSDSSGHSQSESEEEEEDMAALRSRIQVFEQVADGSCGDDAAAKKPEPQPRPRLQGQPAKSARPTVAPKPKNFSPSPKPSSNAFWEDGPVDTEVTPVPAPRPPPPKLSEAPPTAKAPPRPPVAPRAGVGSAPQEQSPASGHAPPPETGSDEAPEQTVPKTGSGRPDIPTKPAALASARRSSAPNLAPKPAGVSPPPPDPNAAPPKPPGPAAAPAPAARKPPSGVGGADPNPSDPPLPRRPSSGKLLPLRPPPIKSTPGRPPPPSVGSANQTPPPPPASKTSPASTTSQSPPSSVAANQTAPQRATKRGPPLPPRPKPGHPLYSSYMKQEVLIVLDDPSGDGRSQTADTPLVKPSQCLLDLEVQPAPDPDQDGQSKESLSESQSILPVSEQKEQPDPAPVSGPRCVAMFDYEGEEEDELTFSQGDAIALLELVGQDWGRGQIHGRVGIFPLRFTEVVEPLEPLAPGEPEKPESPADPKAAQKTSPDANSEVDEWVVALFDFPGQTAEDLSFHKGALIQVTEHIDAEWRRGKLEGREGLYPAAFTQTCQAQPITDQQSVAKGVAKFDFTAESEDELTLKVGDIITQVEPVDEQWMLGVVGGKRGIVPKNYISLH